VLKNFQLTAQQAFGISLDIGLTQQQQQQRRQSGSVQYQRTRKASVRVQLAFFSDPRRSRWSVKKTMTASQADWRP